MPLNSVVSEMPSLIAVVESDWRGEHSIDERMTDVTFG
jgi:hypothetical protein